MFGKATTLLALLVPTFTSALTIGPIPTNLTSGGDITITWTSVPTDPPTFTIELGEISFNNFFGIANNVLTSQGSITFQLPSVPTADDYSLEFVNVTNIGQVYASTSSQFSIAAPLSSTSSSTSTTSSSSSSTSGSGSNSTTTVTGGSTPTTTSSFGITVSSSSTSSSSTSPAGDNGSSTSSSPSTTNTGVNFNAARGLTPFGFAGGATEAVMLVAGAFAGAVFMGL